MPVGVGRLNARPTASRLLQSSSVITVASNRRWQLPVIDFPHCAYKSSTSTAAAALAEREDDGPTSPTKSIITKYSPARLFNPPHRLEVQSQYHWLQRLEESSRVYGADGVAAVWHDMRAADIVLPCTGPYAAPFWRTLVDIPDLRVPIFNYAVELKRSKGLVYAPLYEMFMTRLLKESSSSTLAWHSQISKNYQSSLLDLSSIALAATSSKKSLDNFKILYPKLKNKSNSAYDTLITALCDEQRYPEAMKWHYFLVEHGDSPSIAMSKSTMMKQFRRFENNLSTNPPANELPPPAIPREGPALSSAEAEAADEGRSPEFRFSRQIMYSLLGQAHGIAPKGFSDEFCARLFATKAFSISLVISCLNMFGVQAIGPLALREMACRAESPRDITAKIKDLQGAGISLGNSLFSKAVQKLAAENRVQLLESLLASDQHPDVLEDASIQHDLLDVYLAQSDWLSVHRTLTLLTLFHYDPAQESWNVLLRQYTRQRQFSKIHQVLEDMRLSGVQVTAFTVRCIYMRCLSLRRTSKGPIRSYGPDDLQMVTNIFLQIMESGQRLPARHWQEIIRRHGMEYRFEQLSRLCLRLTQYYSQTWPSALSRTSLSNIVPLRRDPIVGRNEIDPGLAMTLPPKHAEHPLRRIFSPIAIQAIISWGFKFGFMKLRSHPDRVRFYRFQGPMKRGDERRWPSHLTPPPPSTIVRGIALIDSLAEAGVLFGTKVVRKAVKLRLWALFGPGRSQRKANQQAQALNPYTLEELLRAAQSEWRGPPLFPGLMVHPEEVQRFVSENKKERQPLQRETREDLLIQPRIWRLSPGRNLINGEQELPLGLPFIDYGSPVLPQAPETSELGHVLSTSRNSQRCKPRLVFPRFRTILDDLGSGENEAGVRLDGEEMVARREQLMFELFGTRPRVGSSRSIYSAAISETEWKEFVNAWARRPRILGESKFHKIGRLGPLWKKVRSVGAHSWRQRRARKRLL